MIQIDKITDSTTGLVGGVGWRQSTLPGYSDILDADNLKKTSGLCFQDASFLVTIKNIKENQENRQITNDQFNSLLMTMQKSVIQRVCSSVFSGKDDFIKSRNLYPFEKTFGDTLDVDSKFACFKIECINKNGATGKISFIELCFDSDVTFKVYLFNSNKPKTPIEEIEVNAIAHESAVINIDWYLTDRAEVRGGNWYIGYFEDDLNGAKPIKRDYELANVRCRTYNYYISPVKLSHESNVVDISSYVTQSDTSGLNIGIEIFTDYTDLIIKNKNLFWEAIQFQMAIKVIDLIKHSTRTNPTELRTDEMVQNINMELHGYKDDNVYIEGVISKTNRLINSIRKSLFYQPMISKSTLR